MMKRQQSLRYAIYTARQVLDIFEKIYPDDKRPREAINAAFKCLESDTKKNRQLAAAYAASAAADAADAADAAYAYAAYAASERKKIQLKILRYGLEILKKGRKR